MFVQTLLSVMLRKGKIIFDVEVTRTEKTEVVQEQEQTDSRRQRPKLRTQATIDQSPAQYVTQQQVKSYDELKKRLKV